MTVLITVTDGNDRKTSCDSRCHNAVSLQCRCCCGGMNHGVGREQAIENTSNMTDEQINAFCQQGGLSFEDVIIPWISRMAKLL